MSWLTVHARTADQRCEPINMDALRVIKDSVSVPVVGNGDICSVHDAEQVQQNTNVNGMSCIMLTRQVTRATHVRNRVCPREELILKIIIIFLGFIKSKPC